MFLRKFSDSPDAGESPKSRGCWATGHFSLFPQIHGGSHTCTCTGVNMRGREKERITTINTPLALASRGFGDSPTPGEFWRMVRILPRACLPSGWFRLNRIPVTAGRKDVVQSEITILLLWS
jgi:hypothetical protein